MEIMRPRNNTNNSESITSPIEERKGSDVINTIGDEKITTAINKEVDKILRTTLERTNSGSDLKMIAPIRHKKREYRSQEALPLQESIISGGSSHNIINTLPSQSEVQINDLHHTSKSNTPRVSILHENQRAEIIASVTERLYSKLKKKEEIAVSKMESIVDRKIVEPLSELRICTNARQRLIELSQKAIRNKRKINVPVYTQTRVSVSRVKDQGVDVQSDLETYLLNNGISYKHMQDASTETIPMTPRYKEIGVGPKYGSLSCRDISTITYVKQLSYKNSYVMTEDMEKSDNFTQTQVIPPRRRKRRSKKSVKTFDQNSGLDVFSSCPAISINISQTYPFDSESQCSEDSCAAAYNKSNTGKFAMTPDRLTNYASDTNGNEIGNINNDDFNSIEMTRNTEVIRNTSCLGASLNIEDFSDHEDDLMPRILPDFSRTFNKYEIRDIILGRNKNIYPYNILLSPQKQQDYSRRIVSFEDFDRKNNTADETSWNNVNIHNLPQRFQFTPKDTHSETYLPTCSTQSKRMSLLDSSESDKEDTSFLIWKKKVTENKPLGCERKSHVPVTRIYSELRTVKKQQDIILNDGTDKSPDFQYILKPRNKLSEISRNYNDIDNEFGAIDTKIINASNKLDSTLNKYNNNIDTTIENLDKDKNNKIKAHKTPKNYLQHLVQIRREIVKAKQLRNNAVIENSPK